MEIAAGLKGRCRREPVLGEVRLIHLTQSDAVVEVMGREPIGRGNRLIPVTRLSFQVRTNDPDRIWVVSRLHLHHMRERVRVDRWSALVGKLGEIQHGPLPAHLVGESTVDVTVDEIRRRLRL